MRSKPPIRLTALFESFVVVSGVDGSPSLCWIDGRYKRNIRMDRDKHLQSGGRHFHIYGKPRRGGKGKLVAVVRGNGRRSHGHGEIELHDDDANALRARGVPIPPSNIVRWLGLGDDWFMLVVTATDSSSASTSWPTR
jgi:hypothetical protein